MNVPDSLQNLIIRKTISQASREDLVQLLREKLDDIIALLASTAEGKARILKVFGMSTSGDCETRRDAYNWTDKDSTMHIIEQIISQADTEYLIWLLGDNLDEVIAYLVCTGEGRDRLSSAISTWTNDCKKCLHGIDSMNMDRTTTTGECSGMRDPKTNIVFTWCPHWGKTSVGHCLNVERDKAFQRRGVDSYHFRESVAGFDVKPNRDEKQRLLELCESEGMDPETLACLNLLMEWQWFVSPFKTQ